MTPCMMALSSGVRCERSGGPVSNDEPGTGPCNY